MIRSSGIRSLPGLRAFRAAFSALLFAFALPTFAAPAESGAEGAGSESWWVISLDGRPVGSVYERVREREGGVEVKSDFQLVLNRMGSRVETSSSATTLESKEGVLRTLDYDLKLSQQTTSVHAEVGDGAIRLRERSGDATYERSLSFSGELAGPGRLRRLSAERLREVGDRLDIKLFSPEVGQIVTLSRRVLGLEAPPGAAGPKGALKVEESLSGLPLRRTLWLSPDGAIVRSEDPSPFGPMVSARASREEAEKTALGADLPAEVYAATLVRTNVRLPEPRRLERLTLQLRHRRPELGWPDLAGPGQRVIDKTARTMTVEIVRQHPDGPIPFPLLPPTGDPALAELLEPNAMIQSNDPELRATAQRIVAGETDALRAALALQRWVAENLTFDLGVVMAPANEVFRNRRGTCASYATLLTSMLRAAGFPARYVLGFVYVDGILGGHAWSEVRLGDRWVALDGAVPAGGPADAGRLALERLSLREGAASLNAGAALQLFGQIEARVLSYQVEGGELQPVEKEELPYRVSGSLYRNLGLGLELAKPEGFAFADLDQVWPEKTLLALTAPDGARVTLERLNLRPWGEAGAQIEASLAAEVPGGEPREVKVAGATAPVHALTSPERAVAAFAVGDDAWLLRAEGKGAEGRLRQVARGMRWSGRR